MEYITDYAKKLDPWSSWVDLGCGSGRCYSWLSDIGRSDIHYTGSDIAQGAILLAQSNYPQAHRRTTSMLDHLQSLTQQSTQTISAIASLQHLETVAQRQQFFHDCYRVLEYQGSLIMTNWAFSSRFLSKYHTNILFALRRSAITLGRYRRNDLSIPRKDPQRQENGKVYERFYHIFTLIELEQYARSAGFEIEKLGYVDQEWGLTTNWKTARNSIMIARKL